jgi:hypothetical protein
MKGCEDKGGGWCILSADFIAGMLQVEDHLRAGPVKMGVALPATPVYTRTRAIKRTKSTKRKSP